MELAIDGPMLTVYEMRRAIEAAAEIPESRSDNIHVAQLEADQARFVGDVEYIQETPHGLIQTPVRVDVFAIGLDDSFTLDRGMDVAVSSLDPNNRFSTRYRIEESDLGIAYALVELQAPGIAKLFHTNARTNYEFLERLLQPRSITPQDLREITDPYPLALNQAMMSGISRLSGATLKAPSQQ